MIEVLQIVACGVIYFLVVYLFVIRREARPILPWTVCIATQVVSTVFFQDAKEWVMENVFPPEEYGNLGMVIPSALLLVVNLTVIFIMFGNVMTKIKSKDIETATVEEEFTITPLPSVMSENVGVKAEEKSEEDDTLAFIEKMISEGRRDEAVKYLKMLAYYGKDEASRAEASKLLDQLNVTGD